MLKKLLLLSFALTLYVFAVSCSESKAEASVKKSTPVYNIGAVSQAKDGYVVDFKFNQNGKERSFAELTKNKVVFLNFWGTWCGPCRRELPDIIEMNKELSGKDFIAIGIALEHDAPAVALKKVADFGTEKGIEYINFLGNKEIVAAYGGIPAVPTTYIIDKKGKIIEKIVGGRDKATFMTAVSKVLK